MTIPAPPVEAECRRDEFRGDLPITLADGQAWYFPAPRARGVYFTAGEVPAKNGEPARRQEFQLGVTEFGAEYDQRVEEAIIESLNNNLKMADIYWFGRFLLDQNYDLSDRQYYHVLPMLPGDSANEEMWMSILRLASGGILGGRPDPKAEAEAEAAAPTSSNGPGSPAPSTESIPAG
jgi:hypothetical protein